MASDMVYCNASVVYPVPAVGDDAGWADAGAGHEEGCEWVVTRAHRVFVDAPDAALRAEVEELAREARQEAADLAYGRPLETERLAAQARVLVKRRARREQLDVERAPYEGERLR